MSGIPPIKIAAVGDERILEDLQIDRKEINLRRIERTSVRVVDGKKWDLDGLSTVEYIDSIIGNIDIDPPTTSRIGSVRTEKRTFPPRSTRKRYRPERY